MPTGRRTVTVNLQPKPYDIHVQPGMVHDVGMIVARLAGTKQVCVLTDTQVGPHYTAPLTAGFLNAGIRPTVAVCTRSSVGSPRPE